ncbi:asparagine synthase (glutamine-hydrolyzing) [Pelotomaculum propionicicum]|uniref:asparagine synthase (glutamine-hydrolyzing) n=1 Tax=Pelotomaculum propionicicum TaxID=258475 RepID=UPI003B7DBC31
MCGIFGVVRISGSSIYKDKLSEIAHRGPDGQGEWLSPNESVWLGHRRLAIIDPEGGKQPLSNEDGTVWVTFNGCIYNYLELAQTLRRKGHHFRTYSDTEVIVHAYEEYGKDCLKYFIGMFAFAVWDDRKKILFCARDRMGVKPFYYIKEADAFVFASEIKALLSTSLVPKKVDRRALQEYLVFQTVLGEKTLFEHIYKLLPGHYMIVNENACIAENKKYWDLSFDIDYDHTEEYFVDRLRVLLEDAVKIRLRSDVPLGAHLSGGMDSSTVVCLTSMLNITGEKLKTFTGAFNEGENFDETRYSRLVADKAGAECLEIYPTAEDFIETLPKIIYYMDEPAAGPGVFPQYMVSRLASEHVKVVLGGQGGDEIFAGYARYLVGYLEECLKGAIEETDKRSQYAATLASIIPSMPMLQQYVPMLRNFWSDGLFEPQDRRYFKLMDRSSGVKNIYSSDVFSDGLEFFEEFQKIFHGSNAASFLNRMLYFDLKVHLPALLHVEDRTSMAWGLESRVPLLDHRIAELMASIPPVVKFKGGQPKYLFRKAIKNLIPDEVFNRKDKMGFPVPLHLWFRGSLRDYAREVLLDDTARQRGIFSPVALEKAIEKEQDFGRAIWGALCMELWFKTFIDD